MILGQSTAIAAVLAIDNNQVIQDVDYQELREKLLKSGQILEIPENWLTIITEYN
jgi:hypothetical protein